MGARWNWDAVCVNGHSYGNFSGGADDCYECEAEPEAVFNGDDSRKQLIHYMERRRTRSAAEIRRENQVAALHALADELGYEVVSKPGNFGAPDPKTGASDQPMRQNAAENDAELAQWQSSGFVNSSSSSGAEPEEHKENRVGAAGADPTETVQTVVLPERRECCLSFAEASDPDIRRAAIDFRRASGAPEFPCCDGPLLTLEERLLVALARRGPHSIPAFIFGTLIRAGFVGFVYLSDEEFVAACEAYANEIAASEPVS